VYWIAVVVLALAGAGQIGSLRASGSTKEAWIAGSLWVLAIIVMTILNTRWYPPSPLVLLGSIFEPLTELMRSLFR
jgi:hypothetical protein